MTAANKMEIIGTGASAEVYAYEEGKALKLFKKQHSEAMAKHEAEIAEALSKTAIRMPKCCGTTQVDGRFGIIFERIEGEHLLDAIKKDPLRSARCIERMALLQISINQTEASGLPDQLERLAPLIDRNRKIGECKQPILDALRRSQPSCKICHGDFHVGNILQAKGELYAIDWMNSYAGNPESDAARSYLLFMSPNTPPGLSLFGRIAFVILKRHLGKIYLKEYLRHSGIDAKAIRKWLPIIAAARLSENAQNEEAWLFKTIRDNLKFL